MSDFNPNDSVDFIFKTAPKFAKAKSERVYLEQFRKSKKALLMAASEQSSAVMKEVEAYAHPDYLEVLDGLKVATELEEALRWQLVAAQARMEIWRTQSANNRAVDSAAR
jgi:hypothetical protein